MPELPITPTKVLPKSTDGGSSATSVGKGKEPDGADVASFDKVLKSQLDEKPAEESAASRLASVEIPDPQGVSASDNAVILSFAWQPAQSTLVDPSLGGVKPQPAGIKLDASVSASNVLAEGRLLPQGEEDAVHDGVRKTGLDKLPLVNDPAEFAAAGKFSRDTRVFKIETTLIQPERAEQPQASLTPLSMVTSPAPERLTVSPAVHQPVPTATLAPQVGAPGWDAALGQRMVLMSAQNQQVADLHLNPPHLGPLEVRISLSHEHASAVFVSAHPAVREAIESALPRLRDMFAETGLTLGDVNVSSQSFAQQRQDEGAQNSRNGAPGWGPKVTEVSLGSALGGGGRSSGTGMVDLFA